jgi:hypothetical protein
MKQAELGFIPIAQTVLWLHAVCQFKSLRGTDIRNWEHQNLSLQ